VETETTDVKGPERYYIRAILRALDVLEAFSPERPTLSLMEVSEAVGLHASTAFRLLATLQSRGYVEQDPRSGQYRIGVASLRPGHTFLARLNVRDRVAPFLEELRDETRETVHLAILDENTMEVVYLEKLEGLQPIGLMGSRVGGRCPGHCTGVGKALLAYHDQEAVRTFFSNNEMHSYTPTTITSVQRLMEELAAIRHRGYALDNSEHEPGVMCVAVPLRNHMNHVVAAMSVSGPVDRISRWIEQGKLVQRVLQLGHAASLRLGWADRWLAERPGNGEGVPLGYGDDAETEDP
jgi:DNA-binding IclR family transcriptional regulator